jgi:hypothetical protein
MIARGSIGRENGANVYRSPIYLQEVAHRKATQSRDIEGT